VLAEVNVKWAVPTLYRNCTVQPESHSAMKWLPYYKMNCRRCQMAQDINVREFGELKNQTGGSRGPPGKNKRWRRGGLKRRFFAPPRVNLTGDGVDQEGLISSHSGTLGPLDRLQGTEWECEGSSCVSNPVASLSGCLAVFLGWKMQERGAKIEQCRGCEDAWFDSLGRY
jgi:hypothetical protein